MWQSILIDWLTTVITADGQVEQYGINVFVISFYYLFKRCATVLYIRWRYCTVTRHLGTIICQATHKTDWYQMNSIRYRTGTVQYCTYNDCIAHVTQYIGMTQPDQKYQFQNVTNRSVMLLLLYITAVFVTCIERAQSCMHTRSLTNAANSSCPLQSLLLNK